MKLHDKDALITIARNADKPVAFLVGAPLSEDFGGGVPGVSRTLALVRDEVSARDSSGLPRYDAALAGKTGADAYQAALEWLQGNFGQSAVNGVVETAVLKARKASSPTSFEGDGATSDWHIPAGTRHLAKLVSQAHERFPGPILTTNFDPLLSLAIEAAGRRARRRVIQSDGGLAHDVRHLGDCEVVHLHGYWRDSDTLHTPTQLTARRPKLKASLQQILKQRTLVVAAYGGWDDVFARTLAEVAVDDASPVNVLWCFRDTDAGEVERKYEPLLERVEPAMMRGRFLCYGGIDCHTIFADIGGGTWPDTERTPTMTTRLIPVTQRVRELVRERLTLLMGLLPDKLRESFERKNGRKAPGVDGIRKADYAGLSSTAPPATVGSASSPAGWERIDSAYLSAVPPLREDEVIRYFDGAVPTWRHAISAAIPRRQAVSEVTSRLAALQTFKDGCSLQLIRAAGGEGKTTLLLQAASDAAHSGHWTVLWRHSPRVGLAPEHVVNLDAAKQWLIVADDAENLVRDLSESAQLLHEAGRSNVHFFLAARDTDWRFVRGNNPPWDTWLKRHRDILLRGMRLDDALAVVEAWRKCGADGLRDLAALPDMAKQVAALVDAVKDAGNASDEGSLFGGLLAVRFGQNGLQAHVRALLNRLKEQPIEGGSCTLFDALVYVAACHAVGILGLDENVLADLVSVPRHWVQSRVVRPLGEEAAAVQSAGHVLTRHSKVAAAILVETDEALSVDVAEVWSALVRQTVRTSRDVRPVGYHAKIVHAGPRLQEALPKQLSVKRRKEIAIAAAKASVAAAPERLSFVVDLGKTYRKAADFTDALQVFRNNLNGLSSKVDFNTDIRGYWYEWGVSEGQKGEGRDNALANAWLSGLSLSDHLKSAPITEERAKLSCAGLGVAFGKLAQPSPDCLFARGRRAAAYLGRLTNPDWKAMGYFNTHDREANRIGTPHPQAIEEAIVWLTMAVVQAGRELEDPFLSTLADPAHVSFRHLESVLSKKKKART